MAPTAQSRIVDTFFGAVDRLYDAHRHAWIAEHPG